MFHCKGNLSRLGLLALGERRMKMGVAPEQEETFFYCSSDAPSFSQWVNLEGITGQINEGKKL